MRSIAPDKAVPASLDRRRLLGSLAGAGCALALPMLAAAQDDDAPPLPAAPQRIEIDARPIPHFQRAQPDVKRFGRLEYRGGLVLSSPTAGFGGWSGLVIATDGSRLLAVSDVAGWLTADVTYQAGRPAGLRNARLGSLLSRSGRPLGSKREKDAEGLALLDGSLSNGTVLISFERLHRIGRFPVRNGEVQAPTSYLWPDAGARRRMSRNQGIEAVALLKGGPHKGSVIGFAERFTRGSGYHTGWIWIRGKPRPIHLKDVDGFDITDAASLPNGDLIVLERRFRWMEGVKMRLRRLAASEIAPGARLAGETLIQADSGFEIDNMEGIAVHRGANGETVLSLISDDNFNRGLQRTLLLQFTLLAEGARSARP
jgi:hypothetical protein